jgi:hypothetical protein
MQHTPTVIKVIRFLKCKYLRSTLFFFALNFYMIQKKLLNPFIFSDFCRTFTFSGATNYQ